MKTPQASPAAASLTLLRSSALFRDIEEAALGSILSCIGAENITLRKGEIILLAGERPRHVGITLAGVMHVIREDYDGKRVLLAAIRPGEIFAEALCCAKVTKSPVTVIAASNAGLMLLRYDKILQSCPNCCPFHTKLIENMLRLVAEKNLFLQSRMEILSLKSIKEKMMRYLQSFTPQRDKRIIIPFNREELADFLCVERSALSHALARMRKDGLIEYRKNIFILQ